MNAFETSPEEHYLLESVARYQYLTRYGGFPPSQAAAQTGIPDQLINAFNLEGSGASQYGQNTGVNAFSDNASLGAPAVSSPSPSNGPSAFGGQTSPSLSGPQGLAPADNWGLSGITPNVEVTSPVPDSRLNDALAELSLGLPATVTSQVSQNPTSQVAPTTSTATSMSPAAQASYGPDNAPSGPTSGPTVASIISEIMSTQAYADTHGPTGKHTAITNPTTNPAVGLSNFGNLGLGKDNNTGVGVGAGSNNSADGGASNAGGGFGDEPGEDAPDNSQNVSSTMGITTAQNPNTPLGVATPNGALGKSTGINSAPNMTAEQQMEAFGFVVPAPAPGKSLGHLGMPSDTGVANAFGAEGDSNGGPSSGFGGNPGGIGSGSGTGAGSMGGGSGVGAGASPGGSSGSTGGANFGGSSGMGPSGVSPGGPAASQGPDIGISGPTGVAPSTASESTPSDVGTDDNGPSGPSGVSGAFGADGQTSESPGSQGSVGNPSSNDGQTSESPGEQGTTGNVGNPSSSEGQVADNGTTGFGIGSDSVGVADNGTDGMGGDNGGDGAAV